MELYQKRIHRLVLVLFIATVGFFLISIYLFASMEDVLLQEKAIEYERHLQLITDRVDFNTELGTSISENQQVEKLLASIEDLDSHYMTYAELFEYKDSGFTNLSNRTPTYETAPFKPLSYSEFAGAVLDNFHNRDRSYTVSLWFEAEDVPGREMLVSYRWTPQEHEGVSYLLATGISRYSLDMHVPAHVYVVSALRMVVMGTLGILILMEVNGLARAKTESFFAARYGGRIDDGVEQ